MRVPLHPTRVVRHLSGGYRRVKWVYTSNVTSDNGTLPRVYVTPGTPYLSSEEPYPTPVRQGTVSGGRVDATTDE